MRKPIVVSVIAAFLFAATLIALVVGLTLIFPGTPADRVWELNKPAYEHFRTFGRASGISLVILGLITAGTAMGLIHRRQWAWWIAIGIFTVNGAGDIVSLVITRDVLRSGSGVLIAMFFIFCLLRPEVRSFFDWHA